MVVAVLALALTLMILVRCLLLEIFTVPSGSMEDTLMPGDRIAVWRVGQDHPERGQIIVFDGTGSLAPYRSEGGWLGHTLEVAGAWTGLRIREDVFVKRVIGVGGDTVRCCSADGRLVVNGQPLTEPYLPPGEKPSEQEFSVRVPAGRMWVMGDHRSDSRDSRALLGAPGGGMIREDRIIGTPVAIVWPLHRIHSLDR